MANDVAFPVPVGVSNTFANLQPGAATPVFSLQVRPGRGNSDTWTVTFQPVDQNNPGVLTLVDGSGITQVTMNSAGYAFLTSTGGSGWYFSATAGANIAAVTQPTIKR